MTLSGQSGTGREKLSLRVDRCYAGETPWLLLGGVALSRNLLAGSGPLQTRCQPYTLIPGTCAIASVTAIRVFNDKDGTT